MAGTGEADGPRQAASDRRGPEEGRDDFPAADAPSVDADELGVNRHRGNTRPSRSGALAANRTRWPGSEFVRRQGCAGGATVEFAGPSGLTNSSYPLSRVLAV